MVIYRVQNFVNADDMEVKEYLQDEKHVKYVADVMIPIGNGQGFPLHVEFPEIYTIKQCFENFHDCIQEQLDEIKKKHEAKQREANLIVPATSIPKSNGFKLV